MSTALAPHQVEALRERYGTAYVTHALCDVHLQRGKSRASELLGSHAHVLLKQHILHHYELVGNGINSVEPNTLFLTVARVGLPINLDSFSSVMDQIGSAVASGLEATHQLLAAFLVSMQKLWDFFSQLFSEGAAAILDAIKTAAQATTETTWNAIAGAWTAIKFIYETVASWLPKLREKLMECIPNMSTFLGGLVRVISEAGITKTMRPAAKQCLYFMFYAWNTGQEVLRIGPQEGDKINAYLDQCTTTMPKQLQRLLAALQGCADVLANPLQWLSQNSWVRALLTPLQRGAQAVFYVLSMVVRVIGNLMLRFGSVIRHLLPDFVNRNMDYVASKVQSLCDWIGDAIEEAGRQPYDLDTLTKGAEYCEYLASDENPRSQNLDEESRFLLSEAARQTQDFVRQQVKYRQDLPFGHATRVNAKFMAAWTLAEDPFRSVDADEYFLSNTGLDAAAFERIASGLDESQWGAIINAWETSGLMPEKKKKDEEGSEKENTTGLRRRRPMATESAFVGGKPEAEIEAEIKLLNQQIVVLSNTDAYRNGERDLSALFLQYTKTAESKLEKWQLQRAKRAMESELKSRVGITDLEQQIALLESQRPSVVRRQTLSGFMLLGAATLALGAVFVVSWWMRREDLSHQLSVDRATFKGEMRKEAKDAVVLNHFLDEFDKVAEVEGAPGLWETAKGEVKPRNVAEMYSRFQRNHLREIISTDWSDDQRITYTDVMATQLSQVKAKQTDLLKRLKQGASWSEWMYGTVSETKGEFLDRDMAVLYCLKDGFGPTVRASMTQWMEEKKDSHSEIFADEVSEIMTYLGNGTLTYFHPPRTPEEVEKHDSATKSLFSFYAVSLRSATAFADTRATVDGKTPFDWVVSGLRGLSDYSTGLLKQCGVLPPGDMGSVTEWFDAAFSGFPITFLTRTGFIIGSVGFAAQIGLVIIKMLWMATNMAVSFASGDPVMSGKIWNEFDWGSIFNRLGSATAFGLCAALSAFVQRFFFIGSVGLIVAAIGSPGVWNFVKGAASMAVSGANALVIADNERLQRGIVIMFRTAFLDAIRDVRSRPFVPTLPPPPPSRVLQLSLPSQEVRNATVRTQSDNTQALALLAPQPGPSNRLGWFSGWGWSRGGNEERQMVRVFPEPKPEITGRTDQEFLVALNAWYDRKEAWEKKQ